MSAAWWVLASVRARIAHHGACAWYALSGKIAELRFFALSAIINRFATREMRHAALLLGYNLALGYGREGLLLGPLREFSVGNEIGSAARHGDPAGQAAAVEEFALERSLFAAPVHTPGGAR